MKIAGKGNITSGEYKEIVISGSGVMEGNIRCASYKSAGASRCEGNIECENEMSVAGSGSFMGNIKAKSISAAGSLSCNGDVTVKEELKTSGSAKIGGFVKASSLRAAGRLEAGSDIEAENIRVTGVLNCPGLLNAEEIELKMSDSMKIGSIGGSVIDIYRDPQSEKRGRLLVNLIEGDSITLEAVTAKRVSGRVVEIKDHCEIELVQYSEELKVSPSAKVGKTEKI